LYTYLTFFSIASGKLVVILAEGGARDEDGAFRSRLAQESNARTQNGAAFS
jgi:hypothetical protein